MLPKNRNQKSFVLLDEMNRKMVIDRLKKKVSIYKEILTEVDAQSIKIGKRLTDQIGVISSALDKIPSGKSQSDYLTNLQLSLINMTSEIKSMSQKLVNTSNLYQVTMKAINDDDVPIIRVIEKAIPTERFPMVQIIFFILLGATITLILYVGILYFLSTYQKELLTIFWK